CFRTVVDAFFSSVGALTQVTPSMRCRKRKNGLFGSTQFPVKWTLPFRRTIKFPVDTDKHHTVTGLSVVASLNCNAPSPDKIRLLIFNLGSFLLSFVRVARYP